MLRTPVMPRHDQVVTTLTILQLRTDLLQRRLARHADLSAADRAWLETSLGEITATVRALTALIGARGGVLEPSWSDVAAGGRCGPPVPHPNLTCTPPARLTRTGS